MALQYYEKPIESWNVKNLTDYLCDQHREIFGVDYAPFGSWQAERGTIGRVFGTSKKAGTHDKRLIYEWINHVFATYNPSAQYPGVSFGFAWKYRQSELQVVAKRMQTDKAEKEIAETPIDNDVLSWFAE